ncbi:uncharacterized protein LOC110713420 [Chenopodium quinoa]|uniref:uncharacterized protein LOC110713420 n=1 Tax=Chenopodium quinoa TaxID=63459 RepID=UPI000B784635|nr:uncharacterized protein LOC110713420 [Chenopodium quinoa]
MGKCLGISVRPSLITQRVREMWRPQGTLEVIDLGKDVYLFRFSIQDDYKKALLGGPWFIMDHYLMITKWRPNFRPSMNPFDRMTVWIRFPELPVEYYDKEALFDIAKLAGIPIRVNYATDHITRARYARVCLDIDLTSPLISKVWVGNSWQIIEYENIQCLCFLCGKIGHSKERCSLKIVENIVQPTTSTSKDELNSTSKPSSSTSTPNMGVLVSHQNSDYGLWTMVSNKKKKLHLKDY